MNPTKPQLGSKIPVAIAAIILCAAIATVYSNSLAGPFVFDDTTTIRDNPTIRQLWPPWQALFPPAGQGLTSNGRPLVNLSLAINYAIGGNSVGSYHVFNLAIHMMAALVLFGLIRRTLGKGSGVVSSTLSSVLVALVWSLHPLLTEAVTFIVQRAESMMALFYLLTLYCFRRAADDRGGRTGWGALSILSCFAGMACKEVMVSAPLAALLYDRTFVSGSFREAWKRHRGLHVGLMSAWILLAWEVASTGNRGATAGFGTAMNWRPYALTQLTAIVHYLRLCFWPRPLVFDYGIGLVTDPGLVVPCAFAVLVVAAGAFYAASRPVPSKQGLAAVGFAGLVFFAVLAPTSSIVPVATQVMAEHRMYLPSAAVVAATILSGLAWSERYGPRMTVSFTVLLLALACFLGWGTFQRNKDYRSDLSLWRSSTESYPSNARNHSNLGYELANSGEPAKAIPEFMKALAIDPDYADAQNNLGAAYFKLGDLDESVAHYRAALRINPRMASAHYNLGGSLVRMGRVEEGLAEFKASLDLDPNSPEAHYNYATALVQIRRLDQAIPQFREALRIRPDYAEARNNLATALLQSGHGDEALAEYKRTLAADPRSATAHFNLANVLVQAGRLEEAVDHYRQAIQIEPTYAKAHCNLGSAFVRMGRPKEAVPEYREALRLDPGMAEAQGNLARIEAYLQANP